MTKQYAHYTVAVSPDELEDFEEKLQAIKDHFGTESTSTVFQKMVDEWTDIHWKSQKYDQLKDILLGFEAYKYRSSTHVERTGRPT